MWLLHVEVEVYAFLQFEHKGYFRMDGREGGNIKCVFQETLCDPRLPLLKEHPIYICKTVWVQAFLMNFLDILHVYNLWIYDLELVRLLSCHVGQQLINQDNSKECYLSLWTNNSKGEKCITPFQTNSNEIFSPSFSFYF